VGREKSTHCSERGVLFCFVLLKNHARKSLRSRIDEYINGMTCVMDGMACQIFTERVYINTVCVDRETLKAIG